MIMKLEYVDLVSYDFLQLIFVLCAFQVDVLADGMCMWNGVPGTDSFDRSHPEGLQGYVQSAAGQGHASQGKLK